MNERSPARKQWISNLYHGTYVHSQQEFEPSYLELDGDRIARVTIIGTVIDVFQGETLAHITLDDGSATIQVRVFKDHLHLMQSQFSPKGPTYTPLLRIPCES